MSIVSLEGAWGPNHHRYNFLEFPFFNVYIFLIIVASY